MWSRALVIREPWISKILAGDKVWEMRSQATRVRGTIGLIRAGSGLVMGTAELVDCLPPLTARDYFDFLDKHAIPRDMKGAVLENGWVYPWVLKNVRRLASPVPYKHKSGAVIFVTLDDEAATQIAAQLEPSQTVSVSDKTDNVRKISELPLQTVKKAQKPSVQSTKMTNGVPIRGSSTVPTFVFRPQSAEAFGRPLADGRFVVLAGSTTMRNGSPNVKRDTYDRDKLLRDGILVPDTDYERYRFTRDYTFSSNSKAAGVIKDGNASGPTLWRDSSTGETLKDFLSRQI